MKFMNLSSFLVTSYSVNIYERCKYFNILTFSIHNQNFKEFSKTISDKMSVRSENVVPCHWMWTEYKLEDCKKYKAKKIILVTNDS